ncbi:MAG: hypothetical protein U1E45_16295 [Geminicoccaceae bacterium]
MSMGRAYRGIYTYAWDLAEEGVAEVTAKFRDVGATTVTLATSYHAGKFLRPQGTKGRVAIVDDGTVYFRAKPESYGRVKPVLHPMLESFDPLRALAETAPDLDRVAWTVCCHNTRLGTAYPDLVAVNCFGDPYPYSLCPAHPEVRAYVVALCRDIAEQHAPTALALETPGWLPYEHGWHHEFALVPQNAWMKLLLGLCFAPASIAGAKSAGIDAERLRRQAADWVGGWLRGDTVLSETRASDMIAADLALDAEWAAFHRWRCQTVTDLVAEIRAAVPRSTEIWVIPSVQRPSARGWIEGTDLAGLARVADRLEVCAYEPSPAEVAADLFDVRRRVGAEARLNAILRPSHPDLSNGAETAAAARVLRAAGCEGIAFYNYGHWRPGALERIREALAVWEGA